MVEKKTHEPSRARRAATTVAVLAAYALLTVALTWPLARRLQIMDPGDSAYFAWAIAWEIHALKTDPLSLPHANIYHPARNTLGMDEPILGTMILALPLSLVTDDAVLLFNVVRLLTFVLSGFSAYVLARELGARQLASCFAGAVFAFSPIRTDQIAHLSTLGTQWLPLVPAFLIRFSRTGRQRDALLAGFFFVLAAYACGYHGIVGLLVLPIAALPLVWGRWGLLARALPAALLAAVLLLPLRALHAAAFEGEGFVRGRDEAVFHSASVESFLATSSWNRLYGEVTTPFRTVGSNNLFPGLVVLGLAALGVAALVRRHRAPSREATALGLMALAAAVVALGPEVRLLGQTLAPAPFGWLRDTIPMFQSIRVTSRAGMYLALALCGLSALALRTLALRPLTVTLLAIAAIAESLIVPIPMPDWAQVIDTRRPSPPVYSWLAAQPGSFAIVEMPLLHADGLFHRPAYDETIYMVRSTLHWKRLVNGNGGVEPAHYRQVRELARRFPSAECLAALRRLETRYVTVHQGGFGPNQWARIVRDLPRFSEELRPVAQFEGTTVYELHPPSATKDPTGREGDRAPTQ
jgi:hypothetical protein